MKKLLILLLSAVTINAHEPTIVIEGKAVSGFSFVSGNFTWQDAKKDAEAKGGHLATVTSPEEQQRLESVISGKNRDAWIGAEEKNGHWQWVTGEVWCYDNFDDYEPNGGNLENHINIWGTSTGTVGRWNDFRDYYKMSYILERTFVRVGIENPPCGKRFALMVSTDLKNWEIAKDINGKKCMEAFAGNSNTDGVCVWWELPKHQKAFYRMSR
jgi:hypothetical protein|tara:strand:+ start:555 stop:1193 length:639 start_codon:yes stop_codon:yes gene_type:complete